MRLSTRLQRYILLLWIVVLTAITAWKLWTYRSQTNALQGDEMEWIANSLVAGQGFSFDAQRRPLFEPSESKEYFSTAWQEPIYPAFTALLYKTFGQYSRPALVIFQTLFMLLTAIVLYFLGRLVFNHWAGMLAGTLLVLLPSTYEASQGYLGNATLCGLMISLSACLLLWCIKEISVPRGILLGAVLALSALIHAGTLLFIPISAIIILASIRPLPEAWKMALATLLAAVAVMSPWMTRNWMIFGEFVPVRTGLGQIVHFGNPLIAETFAPQVTGTKPPWKASNAADAIILSRNSREREALYDRAMDCIQQLAIPGYEQMNEAQRDKTYLQEACKFIAAEPVIFATLAVQKMLVYFYTGWDRAVHLIALLALLGVILSWRQTPMRILVLLIFIFILPYMLGVPLFYRQRYPIEPLLLLFASQVLVVGVSVVARKFDGGKSRLGKNSKSKKRKPKRSQLSGKTNGRRPTPRQSLFRQQRLN